MAKADNVRHVFPLTSLQIGDLQSYLSHLSLYLPPETKKFYILVDNRPWLKDLGPRPAHLWQLMVTKSRLSPFANNKAQRERKETSKLLESKDSPKCRPIKLMMFKRWISLIDAATLSQRRALLPVKKLRNSLISNSKLHRTLYGFIVFEVAWSDVRGINYLNELQTDTSLATEVKFMKKWEFDSIAQAAKCMSSWFSGTEHEKLLLKEYLDCTIGEVYYDAQEKFPKDTSFDNDENVCKDNMCAEDQSPCCLHSRFNLYQANMENGLSIQHTPPPADVPYKRRKVMKSTIIGLDVDIYPEETRREIVDSLLHSNTSNASDTEYAVEAAKYKDVLILFRFNDRDLPFELRKIIMSDLRLLTLLEAGLPSWAIFFQSYPVFCHLYRPWMCPLARILYVLISVVTVLIGFYDLYKNVPILKAMASRLCGPLFDWIETWEMVSRIRYLGTMLFLHNFEKAFKWFLMIARSSRSFFSILTQPVLGPLVECLDFVLPLWNMCMEIVESICSAFSIVIGSAFSLVEIFSETVLLPVWFTLSSIWTIAMSIIFPVFWILWEILYVPIRLVIQMASFLTSTCACLYGFLRELWLFLSNIVKFTSDAEATVSTFEVSMWHSLWSELFSKVFRAVRSILNGFVAFFTACNRHRLSIYNHALVFTQRLSRPTQRLRPPDSSHGGQTCGTHNLTKTGPEKLKLKEKQS